ncbi:protein rolling stone-like [Branchiostoma floridae]|uniref:Protein rolling stone-like n=1 Tax=Branchiostoma floridae TaxID=7739 RepID=A0A9J7L8K7_BRAFL|nr:protein rolling stone-like [Branchiostoma floridae]
MSCREEFSLAALRLHHRDRSVFSRSPWWRGQVGFLVYRSLMTALTLAILVFLLIYHYHIQGRSDPWPIYLTNWSFTVLTAHMAMALVVCVVDFVSEQGAGPTTMATSSENTTNRDIATVEEAVQLTDIEHVGDDENEETIQDSSGLHWYHKAHWILHNTSITAAFFVTTLYWTLDRGTVSVSSIFEHVVNSIIALLDLSVSGTPVRILNAIYPVAYAAAYAVFYVVYWAAGGKGRDGATALYAVMDFGKDPGMAAVFLVVFVFVASPVFHLLAYGLYRLRELVVTRIKRRTPVTARSFETENTRNVHSQVT